VTATGVRAHPIAPHVRTPAPWHQADAARAQRLRPLIDYVTGPGQAHGFNPDSCQRLPAAAERLRPRQRRRGHAARRREPTPAHRHIRHGSASEPTSPTGNTGPGDEPDQATTPTTPTVANRHHQQPLATLAVRYTPGSVPAWPGGCLLGILIAGASAVWPHLLARTCWTPRIRLRRQPELTLTPFRDINNKSQSGYPAATTASFLLNVGVFRVPCATPKSSVGNGPRMTMALTRSRWAGCEYS